MVAGETDAVKYQLEFHGGELAFKSKSNKKYLTCAGRGAVTKAAKDTPGKDERFVLEDSHPQIKMTSEKNLKVSVAGGIEGAANQKETRDTEIFQLEAKDGKWALKSNAVKYWSCDEDGAIKATAEAIGAAELFTIKWLDAEMAIVASNGKLVSVSGNNYLKAVTDLTSDDSIPSSARFVYELVNRPRLVLRGEYGFIGMLPVSGELQCNKSSYETFSMHISKGVCEIKGTTKDGSEKYWHVSDDRTKITVSGASKQSMYMEFVEDSKFAIRYKDSDGSTYYLRGIQNGALNFTATGIDKESLWEF
jgi:fascin 1/2